MASLVCEYIFLFFFLHSCLTSSNKIQSHVEFLESLSGVQKGNNLEGIHELKKYLTYLGYSNHDNSSNNQTQEENNIFDDTLELALRRYQQFYNLNVTGLLDATTIMKMREPRCGMPDFYNYRDVPIHMASRYSFFPDHPKWHKRMLTYAFNRYTKQEAIPPLESAMRQWASVTLLKFFRVNYFRKANIRVSFLHGSHGDGLPFDGPNSKGGLAHSFAPPDGRIHFDAAQKWAQNGDQKAFDVETVGLHELGHALGLGHSNVRQAVMYAMISPGERKKLHEDDIEGIKTLYQLK